MAMSDRWPTAGATLPRIEDMLGECTEALTAMHRGQVHRDRWPEFAAFDVGAYPAALRREAAVQWAGRACAEHGSIHQFSAVTRALCEARVPLPLLGALARLITDEVRHAELCAAYAAACYPEAPASEVWTSWRVPKAPWPDAPSLTHNEASAQGAVVWAADAIMTACCFGETLSVPMLKAIAVVATDPVAQAVAEQILRDEHLHARFGWEALRALLGHIDADGRAWLQGQLPTHMAGFEVSTCVDVRLADLLDDGELTIEAGTVEAPNLGVLTHKQYAFIFYHTVEQEIFPQLRALGFDPAAAWAAR